MSNNFIDAHQLAEQKGCTLGQAYRIIRENTPLDRPVGRPVATVSDSTRQAVRLYSQGRVDLSEAITMAMVSRSTFFRHRAKIKAGA